MKKIVLIIYYLIISKLPSSWWPGGGLFNRLRIFFLRRVIKVGSNTRLQKNVYVGSGNNIVIGENCQINENVRLDNVSIGNNVMIAREVIFLGKTHNSETLNIPMSEQGRSDNFYSTVGNDVWIGIRTIVLPGIEIGERAIIGAGSVVTKDVDENCVYAGNPATFIKKLDKKEFNTRKDFFKDPKKLAYDFDMLDKYSLKDNSFFNWLKSLVNPNKSH